MLEPLINRSSRPARMSVRAFWRRFGRLEHERLEFKRSALHLQETVVAMAMSFGGVVLVGVTDDRRLAGCEADQATLDRIAAGEKLRFPNDGSVFQNRERRLPKQPSGYYREYVVPTPSGDGPGPQRLVIGQEGETFYTHDHYRTFRRVK